jgi:hypothetical protein
LSSKPLSSSSIFVHYQEVVADTEWSDGFVPLLPFNQAGQVLTHPAPPELVGDELRLLPFSS